jgi:hypothetical protein
MSAASAKSQIDFSGHYRTYMYGNFNQTMTNSDNKAGGLNGAYTTDFTLYDRLQFDTAFHATDEISVYWRLRAPARQRWGQYTAGDSIQSRYFYGEVKQDWGTVSIGRLQDAYADLGLASLGWAPSGPDVNATYMGVFDWDDAISGIRYANRWDNGFQLAAAFLRPESGLKYSGLQDETNDLAILEPAFFWDGGGASFGIHYQRDHIQTETWGTYQHPSGRNNPRKVGAEMPAYKFYAVNPAVAHSFGDFSIHFEGKMGWGTWQEEHGDNAEDIKISGYAAYFDVDYNYGPGNVNLAAWWASGTSDSEDDETKITGAQDMGGAFAPLVVAFLSNGNGWNLGSTNAVALANELSGPYGQMVAPQANHMAVDLNGAHAFTDDLTLTYALAYLTLNKTREGDFKKDIGIEADLGLQIQLLDNLHLGTTFGYLKAGKALKDYASYTANADGDLVGVGEKKNAKDAYTWLTTLTFNF